MFKKVLASIILLSSVIFNATSQTSSTASLQPNVSLIPNSPEAAALGKFGELPVALYTGIPDISVPIHNIKLKGFTMPISLSYHSGGIKVNELASNVGLGWALNAGGVITSTINGISDLIPTGWLYTAARTPQSGEIQTQFAPSLNEEWTTKPDYWLLYESSAGEIDTQPDIFTINLPGRSIKFFFDQNGNPLTIPAEKIKIEFLGYNVGFRITDNNDIIYEFKSVDIATTHVNRSLAASISVDNPSYFLTKITTTDNEVINFTYADGGTYISENQPSKTRYLSISGTANTCELLGPNSTTSQTYFTGKYLSKVTSSRGDSIIFTYNFTRLDVPEIKALTNIQILDEKHNLKLKSLSLNYQHFDAGGSVSDRNNYRLKLTSVQESNEKPYTFQYDDRISNRISNSQDHWGYFNSGSNTDLLPINIVEGFNSGANREVEPVAAKAGTLNRITYPTGGYSTFEYESNRYLGVVNTSPTTGSVSAFSVDNETVRKSFVIAYGYRNLRAVYRLPANGYTDENTGIYTDCYARILDADDNIIATFRGNSASGGDTPALLGIGQYYLEIVTQGSYSDGSFKLSWTKDSDPSQSTNTDVLVGGLRIKNISNFVEDNGLPVSSKNFQYLREDGKSSGKATFIPRYTYPMTIHKLVILRNLQAYVDCFYTVQNSEAPTGSVKGRDIFYNHVTVYDQDKTSNGYTTSQFTVPSGYSAIPQLPFPPVFANDWFAGELLESTTYKYSADLGKYIPVQKVKNEYKTSFGTPNTALNEHVVRGFKTSILQEPAYYTFQSGIRSDAVYGPGYSLEYFNLYSSWTYKTKSQEIFYDPSDSTKTTISEHLYSYENPNHMQLTTEEIRKSTGDQLKIKLKYPKDVDASFPYYANPILEKRILSKMGSTEKLLSAEIVTYNNQPGYYPKAFYKFPLKASIDPISVPELSGNTIPDGYEKRTDYRYDGSNNIKSILTEGLQKSGYRWIDNLLVAEIKNADETEFFVENFENSGTTGNPHTGNRHSGGGYTVHWVRPNSRSYVISYFYLQGDAWLYKEESYSADSFALTGGSSYDDVRIFPADSQMTLYTYGPLGLVTSIIDSKGLTSTFEYDDSQRLKYILDQNKNIIRSNEYHYKN